MAMTPPADPFLGRVLEGRYRIVAKIGEGGMAKVYEAARIDGGRNVAVKVLSSDLVADPEQKERFEREARALFGLAHPHLLTVHDFGVVDGLPFLVMEKLDGKALDKLLEGERLDAASALSIAKQILQGLGHAHAQGVLHRDLKADNVFVSRDPNGGPRVKLLDFGLVKFVDDDRWGSAKALTTYGEIFGTPAYMSPEQCMGERVDARTDVYSMGVLLYELLTGVWPFMEETKVDMLRAHLQKPPPPLSASRPDLRYDPRLDGIVQRAMAKKPEARFADANEMLAALEAIDGAVASPPGSVPGSSHGRPPSGANLPAVQPGGPAPLFAPVPLGAPLVAIGGAHPSRSPLGLPPPSTPGPQAPASSRWIVWTVLVVVSFFVVLGLIAGIFLTTFI
jgi:serine/threonine protein kinase